MNDELASMLQKQISLLGDGLNRRLDQQDRAQVDFKTETRQALDRIEKKVDKTNGRVTVLERARERGLGVLAAFRWVPPILTAGFSAAVTLLIMGLTGSLHW